MIVTDVKTFLVDASRKWRGRNWLFVKVYTDEGVEGLGEASGWPSVVEKAIRDLKHVVIGENPFNIERIWQRMLLAFMGHGLTGVVGAGAMTGIEIALWDIVGKALKTPLYNLLGGKCREKVKVYGHAHSVKEALNLVDRGYKALKMGLRSADKVGDIREAVGEEVDLCIDLHGPPWLTLSDAINLGKRLEKYNLLFIEDPVPPENLDGLAKVKSELEAPIAAGERWATVYGFRDLIEREVVDIIQPDMGRVGGITQLKKICGMAEAHFISVAPHDGSNGPVAEAAALHVCTSIPNFLILEHLADDLPLRQEVVTPIEVKDGYMKAPSKPGLGVELDEEVAVKNRPREPNISMPPREAENLYWRMRFHRAKWLNSI
ncbi:mandelate racemase/muconate lactonizing enzyme family protein [Candidatus Bathyarchaeota archaeon]|nr:mandelate racemase/muconate lactonizing enzyme family protein [Candidatus Bathyarchaeota archaeon]